MTVGVKRLPKYITLLNRASRVTFNKEFGELSFHEKEYIKELVDRMIAERVSGSYGGKYKKYIREGGYKPVVEGRGKQ